MLDVGSSISWQYLGLFGLLLQPIILICAHIGAQGSAYPAPVAVTCEKWRHPTSFWACQKCNSLR